MTGQEGMRLVVVAVSVAAVQALLIDGGGSRLFHHLDLPLAAVVVLVLLRPDSAVMGGLIFGLAIDIFHARLFGIHGLAYSVLGSVAAVVPVGALRTRIEAVSCLAAAQSLVAVSIVTAGVWLSSGHLPPDTFGRYVQTTAWTLLIVVPVMAAAGPSFGVSTPDPPGRPAAPTSAEWS